jgi:hypothetical protein
MRNLLAASAAAAVLGSAAACGAAPIGSALPVPSPPAEALKPWASFPANADPRPLIVFGDTIEHTPGVGFPDSERKIAWLCDKIVLAGTVALPAEAAPGEIGAARAYGELMAARAANTGSMPECATAVPFVITGVRHASAGFPTDRGTQQLPAWLFDVPEVGAYIGHLALDPSSLWPGRLSTQGRGARVGADGRTLKIGVTNPGTGPCDSGRYTASVAESRSAVAVAVLRIPNPSPPGQLVCPLVATSGFVTVRLAAALGGRVLVDEKGDAGEACPEAGAAC